jgi:hypothetical protein
VFYIQFFPLEMSLLAFLCSTVNVKASFDRRISGTGGSSFRWSHRQ